MTELNVHRELNLAEALNSPKDIGFDFETTGLDWINDNALFLGLANKEFSGYIDVRKYTKEDFAQFLRDFFKTHRPILQNAKFDFHVAEQFTQVPNDVEFADSMLISQIIDENVSHGLDNMTSVWLGDQYLINKRAVDEYKKAHKLKTYGQIPPNLLAARGVEDAYNTFLLYNILRPKLEETAVYSLEKKVMMVLLRVERNGVLIDKEHLLKSKEELETKIKAVDDKYPDMNLGSPDQIAKYLFIDLGLKPSAFTPKGKPKTDEEALKKIDHPVARDVVEYKHLTHTLSTYITGFLDKIDSNNIIHCNFKQMGARTGRMSCVNPNLQQLPKKGWIGEMVKKAFIGNVTTYDYSQEEAILYAYLNNDTNMIKAVEEGLDLYKYLAQTLYNKAEISKDERELGKVIFLGRIYGMGDRKFKAKSQGLDPKSSGEFFNKLKDMQKRVDWDVQTNGYVKTIIGRRRHLDLNEAYKGLNAIIQGSAADIMKKVLVNLPIYIQDKVMSQVHDEIVFNGLSEEDKKLVGEILCDFKPFKLRYEMGSGNSWWAAYQDKEKK